MSVGAAGEMNDLQPDSLTAHASVCWLYRPHNYWQQPVAYRGGGWGVQTPPPEIPKAHQNRAKLNPIVKTVKNCWI